ncbi:PKD domain-containing protein [Lentisalinibacter orientalis]|uniref:PKD domain-containing protein n=1 Tax=Lentisalinibacter orientalis TaxID=2992241 RepID=UPI00386A0708
MQLYRKFTFVALVSLLAACGGGGGGGGTVAPPNEPPMADAGADQQVRGGDAVSLSGAGSSDSDGTISSYSWSQTAGTSVTLQGASTATATFTAPNVAETLEFTLTVRDNDNATATDTVSVTIEPNEAPTADAGGDQTVNEGSLVTLAGSGTDPDGTIASYSWVQVGGASIALSGADTATATFDAPALALGETLTVTFELTVTDNNGATDTDTATVTVNAVAGVNIPPVANAGPDRVVFGTQTVTLDGSGSSDAEETLSTLGFLWEQIGGPAVTITGADQAQATFDAPDVVNDTLLNFRLTVTDSDGASDTDLVELTVREAPATVTISGKVQFEFVPRGPIGTGLDFSDTEVRPIRGATVQAIAASDGTVLAEGVASDSGDYSLTVPSLTDVFIRVRAELKRTGSPAWDVEIRDNTSNIAQPLGQRPLYVLDHRIENSGGADSVRNPLAQTGWTGSGYTEPRAAAPFSVLDVIYQAMQLVTSVDPAAQFAPLDAFWSVNNSRDTTIPACISARNDQDPATDPVDYGCLGTSFYRPSLDSLFLLGKFGDDTEEFDTHVIAHEWGHYFEDVLSRSDSTGGGHSLDDRLDPRLAFGEGWGNAVAGMVMGDPQYFDTFAGSSFGFSVDTKSSFASGWYNETSVQSILWDLFDSTGDDVEAEDLTAFGFHPLYDVLTGPQRVTPAFTTLFSFIDALKIDLPSDAAAIDALVSAQNIDPIVDIWGDSEAGNNPGATNLLPVHAELQLGSTVTDLCVTRQFDPNEDGNKLGIFRYLRFTVNATANYRISVTTTNPPSAPQGEPAQFSDPDFFVLRSGEFIDLGATGTQNAESLDLAGLPAGTYVIELFEAGFPNVYGFTTGSADFSQDTMCFDVSLSQF